MIETQVIKPLYQHYNNLQNNFKVTGGLLFFLIMKQKTTFSLSPNSLNDYNK